MDIKAHFFDNKDEINTIIGMSHFIKTVDDLAEIIATTVPGGKFGIAFCEASGPALIRHEGNDMSLVNRSVSIMNEVKAGHTFAISMRDMYPINILSKIKACDEVVRVFCATANPFSILTVSDSRGAAIVGVIDGVSPIGIETDDDKALRRKFLRNINYKY